MLFILYARTPFWMNIVAGPTIAYISIVMNVIIFVALFDKTIRTPSTVLMQGLALADGLTALCTYGFEPFFNFYYEEIGTTKYSVISEYDEVKKLVVLRFPYCLIHYCLSNLVETFHLISILLTTCLGLQKIIAVTCPIWSKTQITNKGSAIVCVTCFLLTLTLAMPRLFVVSLSRGEKEDICLVSEPHQTMQHYVLVYYPICYAIILAVAIVTMLLSTCVIIFTLCRRKRVRRHVAVSKAEKKSCILIVFVMIIFFLSEVPRIVVSVTLFSTYRSNLDSSNVASHLTKITWESQIYSECISDYIDPIYMETTNRSCISSYNEIPSDYKAIVEKEVFVRIRNIFNQGMKTYLWRVESMRFKDKFSQYLYDGHTHSIFSSFVYKLNNFNRQHIQDYAVKLYCENIPMEHFRWTLLWNQLRELYELSFTATLTCGFEKFLSYSSYILGSSPYSDPMNYILNIASGYIDITLEHIKLITEILKLSMIIGCGSNFLIYIIMSEKLRNALKKTFKCGGDQDVREDVMEMQRRR